jgi:hypothetical protein
VQLRGDYASGNPTTAVSAIGDAASETTPGGAGSAIAVAKANIDFIIIIVPPAPSTAMQKVAQLAAGRVG